MATKRKIDAESEAALKAVEDALNFDLSDDAPIGDDSFAELERSMEEAAKDLIDPEELETAQASVTAQPATSEQNFDNNFETPEMIAANDVRRNAISELVHGLQKKPSRAPVLLAALFSVFWLGLVGYYLYNTEPSYFNGDLTIQQIFASSRTYMFITVALVPVFFFWTLAFLIKRAQEMRFAAQSMTEAAVRLMQPEGIAIDSLASVGRAIRREVSSINSSFEQTLARAGDLESMVQNEVLNLERSYADSEIKMTSLVGELGAEREMVLDHASKLRDSIAQSHVGLSDEMRALEERLQARINETGLNVTTQLESSGANIVGSLERSGSFISTSFADSSEKLSTMLAASGLSFDEKLGSAANNFQSLLDTRTENLANTINNAGQNAASLIETQSASLREQGDHAAQQIEDAIGMRISDFTSRINESGNELQSMLDTRLDTIDSTLTTKGDAFVTALGTRTEALDRVLSDRTATISETLAERLSTFGQQMTGHIDSVVEQLKSRHAALAQTTTQINDTIVERSGVLVDALQVRNNELSEIYLNGETGIRNSMVSGLTELIGKAEDIRLQIDGQHSQLIDNLDDKSSSLVSELDDRIKQLAGSVESNTGILRELMDEKTDIIFSGINARTTDLLSGMDTKSRNFAVGLEGSVQNVGTVIEGAAANIANVVEAGKQNLEVVIDQKGSELSGIMQLGQEGMAQAVESKYGLFSKLLDEKRDMISVDLDERINATAGVIDTKAAKISEILTQRAEIINESLGTNLTQNQHLLETKASEFNEILNSRTSELEQIINDKALPLVDAIKKEGDVVAVKMGAVHETISDDVGALLSKLGTASEALGSLIIKSSEELTSMERNITVQAEQMKNTVLRASQDVESSTAIANDATGKLNLTSKNLLANIGEIAERFDTHGSLLQQATSILDQAQTGFAGTLEEKSAVIDNLAQGLASRSSEIELSMAAFAQMLTKTMEDATQRTRMVNSTLGDEIRKAMDETNARFAASSEAMRSAAGAVQSDLEETRAQMRRGVMELPEETKQSADAMRKVVADQIAALRDLSEIVTRSGKAMDASPAAAQPRYANAPAPAPMASATPTAPSARTGSYFPPRTNPTSLASSPLEATPAPVAPSAYAKPPKPAASGNNSGWVSDLLARASVDDPSPNLSTSSQPLPMSDGLNSLSMDIATQVDHQASLSLWSRYQRGERNVFTRQLYTPQGQQTFDEIRGKYSRDPGFKNAIDRYISDFERLLEEVAKNDRDNVMVQNYLTSDTGKVYTMLAHASGRLGNA